MIDDCRIIKFKEMGDERGNLVVAEGNGNEIPFEIKRVFYIYGSDKKVIRGQHANIRTRFVLINVSGKSKVRVDNGHERTVFKLDQPKTGLYLGNMLWKEMFDFSEDSVLLVLCSEHYDENEYIRDYAQYIEMVNGDIEK